MAIKVLWIGIQPWPSDTARAVLVREHEDEDGITEYLAREEVEATLTNAEKQAIRDIVDRLKDAHQAKRQARKNPQP